MKGLLRGLWLHAIFCAAFAVCGWALRGAMGFPEVSTVSAKLTHLEEHGHRYDTLFVGSSRIYFQVLPTIFDSLAAENGLRTTSFNAGVENVLPPEDSFILEQVLARRGEGLRYVFLELSLFRANFLGVDLQTERAVYWHDTTRTLYICRFLAEEARRKTRKGKWERNLEAWKEALGFGTTHIGLWFKRNWQLGRGAGWAQKEMGLETTPAKRGDSLGPDGDGYAELKRHVMEMTGARLAEYEREYAERLVKPSREFMLNETAHAHLERMIAAIRGAGAEPILVITPTTAPAKFVPRRDLGIPILDFSDVHRWPELFAVKNRLDTGHVNAAGARVFTRHLFEEFVKTLPPGREPGSLPPSNRRSDDR